MVVVVVVVVVLVVMSQANQSLQSQQLQRAGVSGVAETTTKSCRKQSSENVSDGNTLLFLKQNRSRVSVTALSEMSDHIRPCLAYSVRSKLVWPEVAPAVETPNHSLPGQGSCPTLCCTLLSEDLASTETAQIGLDDGL